MRYQNPSEGRRHPHGGRGRRQPSPMGWRPNKGGGEDIRVGAAWAGCPAGWEDPPEEDTWPARSREEARPLRAGGGAGKESLVTDRDTDGIRKRTRITGGKFLTVSEVSSRIWKEGKG